MKLKFFICLLVLIIGLHFPEVVIAQLRVHQSVITSGGTELTGNSNSIVGTIGQPLIGISDGPTISINAGFWYAQKFTVLLSVLQRVIASGGTNLEGNQISILGTVGQPLVGISGDSLNFLNGGFWYTHAAVIKMDNTSLGQEIAVQPVDSVTGISSVLLTFAEVTGSGESNLTTSSGGSPPLSGFKLGSPPTYYVISTTAIFNPPVNVCIDYTAVSYGSESNLKLSQLEEGLWVNRTTSLDTVNNLICASVDFL